MCLLCASCVRAETPPKVSAHTHIKLWEIHRVLLQFIPTFNNFMMSTQCFDANMACDGCAQAHGKLQAINQLREWKSWGERENLTNENVIDSYAKQFSKKIPYKHIADFMNSQRWSEWERERGRQHLTNFVMMAQSVRSLWNRIVWKSLHNASSSSFFAEIVFEQQQISLIGFSQFKKESARIGAQLQSVCFTHVFEQTKH